MRFAEVSGCALPVVAGRGRAARYCGTGMLVRHGGRHYVLTAPRCATGPAEQLDVRGVAGALAVNGVHRLAPDEAAAADGLHVVIIDVSSRDATTRALDLATAKTADLPQSGDAKLLVRGYAREPGLLHGDDADVWPCGDASGAYIGPTRHGAVHTALLDHRGRTINVAGLYGAPVFVVTPRLDGLRARVAGLVVNRGAEVGVFHFIAAPVLRAAVKEVHRRVLATN